MAKRIVIAEDEQVTAMELQAMVEDLGYESAGSFAHGRELLEYLEDNSDSIDLVLMDIRLSSEIDGVEAAEEISEKYDLPVVYVTAHSDRKTLDRAKETSPMGYIIKPVTEQDLLSSIEIALG